MNGNDTAITISTTWQKIFLFGQDTEQCNQRRWAIYGPVGLSITRGCPFILRKDTSIGWPGQGRRTVHHPVGFCSAWTCPLLLGKDASCGRIRKGRGALHSPVTHGLARDEAFVLAESRSRGRGGVSRRRQGQTVRPRRACPGRRRDHGDHNSIFRSNT